MTTSLEQRQEVEDNKILIRYHDNVRKAMTNHFHNKNPDARTYKPKKVIDPANMDYETKAKLIRLRENQRKAAREYYQRNKEAILQRKRERNQI